MPRRAVRDERSSYAGRWVARVRGRIVAQGGTPEQARLAAQTSRPKETPEVSFMPSASPLAVPALLEKVQNALPDDRPVYLVGGALRDSLMGRTTHDLDFAVPQGGIKLARQIAGALHAGFFPLDPQRDTGRVVIQNPDGTRDLLDFAAYRGADLESDLAARDFTINALAYDVHDGTILDPLNGSLDLHQKRIRACAATAFVDDPVRILRAVRQAAAFGFSIQPETRREMKKAVALLANVSAERLRDELFKTLDGPRPAAAIHALELLGALPFVLPELPALKGVEQPEPHLHEVWAHTLKVMDHLETILAVLAPVYDLETASDLFNSLLVLKLGRYRTNFAEHFRLWLNAERSPRALLFLAALYHDVAKPRTKTIEAGRIRFLGHDEAGAQIAGARAGAFNLSNDEIQRLELIVRNHMRLHFHTNRLVRENQAPSRRAIYRFFRDAGEAGVDLVLLALADLRATYDHTLPQERWEACLDTCRIMLENWWDKPHESVAPPSLVNGGDVMAALELMPGPRVGQVLEAVREAQAMGQVATREQALAFARQWLAGKNSE